MVSKMRIVQHEDDWRNINSALRFGSRGLPGGDSLANLLERNGRKVSCINKPNLTEEEILKACEDYHKTNSKWPGGKTTDPVPGLPNETFRMLDVFLTTGGRGLRGGSSIFKLLVREGRIVILTEPIIIKSCDEHYKLTGKWPHARTKGSVPGLPDETWSSIDESIRGGLRGSINKGELSLARLLEKIRNKVNNLNKPKLTDRLILSASDEYHKLTGNWPSANNKDSVPRLPDETWRKINEALTKGFRGLPGGSSLSNLLEEHGRKLNQKNLPRLTEKKIIRASYLYHKSTGKWPTERTKGPVPGMPNETWTGISIALYSGYRGFAGGNSLAKLLEKNFGRTNHLNRPKLTLKSILIACRKYHSTTGTWPHKRIKDSVPGLPNETWMSINSALAGGWRGLPGGSSLPKLIRK